MMRVDVRDPSHPCPGRCNTTWWRDLLAFNAAHALVRGEWQPRAGARWTDVLEQGPTPGAPVWCREDADLVVRDLQRLPDLAAQLSARADGRVSSSRDVNSDRRATGLHQPGSAALDLIDAVASWIASEVDDLDNHLDSTRARAPQGTRDRVRWLSTGVGRLVGLRTAWLCTPWAVQSGRAATRWVARLERAAGVDRLQHRLTAPCPRCSARALVREDGDDLVRCGMCNACWDEAHYRHLAKVLADGATG